MRRRSATVLAALAAFAAPACGGDDDEPEQQGSSPGTTESTAPPATSTDERTETGERTTTTETGTSPEDQEGGAGDEEAIRTPASVTGRAGRLRPARIRVAPFIAVELELRSADGRAYGLRVDGRELRVGGDRRRASLMLDGIRPEERYVARPIGAGNAVVIEASGEPGP